MLDNETKIVATAVQLPKPNQTAANLRVSIVLFCCLAILPQVELLAQDQTPTPQTPSNPLAPSTLSFTPLTEREKFHHYLKSTYGPVRILRSASMAGINQWRDHTPEWGQGMAGYGRRLGSKFGQHVIKRTVQLGVGMALHEDPRYFHSERSGFGPRAGHAIVSTIVTRKDDGSNGLAVSRIVGAFAGGLISRTWQPERNSTVGDGFRSSGVSIGIDAGFRVFQEFWPDIRRRLRH